MPPQLKRYWAELLVFGAILGTLLLLANPNFTWINTNSDGIHYTYSAKYLYPAHKTSAPLFLLLGHFFLKLPFGTDAWRFALLSVLASTTSAIFIYLIIKEKLKENNDKKTYALIGSLIFGSSALVISQSIIIETYALVTMFGLGAYYFASKAKWLPCALLLGAGGAVHHLIGFPILVLLATNKELRQWKYLGIMASFLLFYLYIPITNRSPYMWFGESNLAGNFLADNLSTALMLIGGLSIWELPKRIIDATGVIGVSLVLALLPIVWFIKSKGKSEPLLWLFLLPIIYYSTDLAPQTYVYMMPAIGSGAIMAGIGLAKKRPYWKWVMLGTTIIVFAFNINYFDIGRTLDPELSANKYYNEELPKVPDNEILLTQQGWEWAAIYLYNQENDRNIIPISAGTLPSLLYQEQLKSWGVKFATNPNDSISVKSTNIALSIMKLNENVWTTIPTNPRTYGAKIVPAKGNENRLMSLPLTLTDGTRDMVWEWKPSNPYDIITGAIEVDEWVWIIFSNYSILTFSMLGVIGMIPVWFGYMIIVKRKKWSLRKQEIISNV